MTDSSAATHLLTATVTSSSANNTSTTTVSVTPSELQVNPNDTVNVSVTWPDTCPNSIEAVLQFVNNSEDPIDDKINDNSSVEVTRTNNNEAGQSVTPFTINSNATVASDQYILTLNINNMFYSVDPRIKVRR